MNVSTTYFNLAQKILTQDHIDFAVLNLSTIATDTYELIREHSKYDFDIIIVKGTNNRMAYNELPLEDFEGSTAPLLVEGMMGITDYGEMFSDTWTEKINKVFNVDMNAISKAGGDKLIALNIAHWLFYLMDANTRLVVEEDE